MTILQTSSFLSYTGSDLEFNFTRENIPDVIQILVLRYDAQENYISSITPNIAFLYNDVDDITRAKVYFNADQLNINDKIKIQLIGI